MITQDRLLLQYANSARSACRLLEDIPYNPCAFREVINIACELPILYGELQSSIINPKRQNLVNTLKKICHLLKETLRQVNVYHQAFSKEGPRTKKSLSEQVRASIQDIKDNQPPRKDPRLSEYEGFLNDPNSTFHLLRHETQRLFSLLNRA